MLYYVTCIKTSQTFTAHNKHTGPGAWVPVGARREVIEEWVNPLNSDDVWLRFNPSTESIWCLAVDFKKDATPTPAPMGNRYALTVGAGSLSAYDVMNIVDKLG